MARSRRARLLLASLLAAVPLSLWTLTPAGQTREPDWPAITRDTKPWTRWWWHGSAVDRSSLTSDLEAMQQAGIGGVEITPIYGVRGEESRFIPFLSDTWVSMLEHVLREGQRLDIGVDMALGQLDQIGDADRSLLVAALARRNPGEA